MKGLICLTDKDDVKFSGNYMLYPDYTYDYIIKIGIDSSDDYNQVISNCQPLRNSLETLNRCSLEDLDPEYIYLIDSAIGNEERFISDAEYVLLNFGFNTIAEFINKNPSIKNKKIILPCTSNMNYTDMLYIEKIFGSDASSLYFKLDENDEIIGFDECKESLKIIHDFIEKVFKLNLSPLEQVMYLYDRVKSRIYKGEDEGEKDTLSRDMTSTLLQDKIVCLGYSNIMKKALRELGFKVDNYSLHNTKKDTYHSRNVLYIKDYKYDIDGVYFLDATWDSKRHPLDTEYLNNYKHFLRTKEQQKKQNYVELSFGNFDEEFIKKFELDVKLKGIAQIDAGVIDTINNVSRFIDGQNLLKSYYFSDDSVIDFFVNVLHNNPFDLEQTVNKLKQYNSMLNREINGETFMKALLTVRSIEYYENPDIKFDREEFIKASIVSKWTFNKTKHERFLQAIFGKKVEISTPRKASFYVREAEIDETIEKVKTARVLRKVLEKKK